MTFAVINDGKLSCLVVNADKDQAEKTLKIHGKTGRLIPVSIKERFNAFKSCIFAPNDVSLTWPSKWKLWAKGISIQG